MESDPRIRDVLNSLAMKYEMDFWSTGVAFSNELTIKIDDPIYKSVEIGFPESRLLTTSLMIRTNNIKQLGSTRYINSGATHTRLSHQLGAHHLSKEIWKAILSSAKFREKVIDILKKRIKEHWLKIIEFDDVDNTVDRYQSQIIEFLDKIGSKIVSAAVLLHDIGHGGWGHILDPLNGFIARRIVTASKSLEGLLLGYRFDRVMAEAGKLDITTAIYIILNNEQIVKALTEGFTNYTKSIMERSSGDKDFYKVFLDMVTKLNIIPTIIALIIFEDMGIPVKRGSLWTLSLTWYSGLSQEKSLDVDRIKASKIFAIIVELLAIIVMMGIQILGDIETKKESEKEIAGFNVDRLDWIPRDSFHLGLYTSANVQSDSVSRHLNKICDMINKILEDPEQNLEFDVEDDELLLYIYPYNKAKELHKAIREVRKFMYDTYHHNMKGIYDSILVRTAYAAASIIWNGLAFNVNQLLAIRTAIAHILNNDELFISNTSEVLRAVRSVRDSYISTMLSLLPMLKIENDNYYKWVKEFSKQCDVRCRHIINNLYVLFSADEDMLQLMNQPYALMHLNLYDVKSRIYQPVHIEMLGSYPNKIIIIEEIRLEDVEPLKHLITLIKENNEFKELQKRFSEAFSYFSNNLERVEIPLLEYMLNEALKHRGAQFDHIYVNYVNYGLRDYADILKSGSSKLDDERIKRIMSRPLLYIFFSYSVDKTKKGETEKEGNTYIDKVRDYVQDVQKAINAWMKYVIIKNMPAPAKGLLEKAFSVQSN